MIWIDKGDKLLRSPADIIFANSNFLEGQLAVLPMYNCNYSNRRLTDKIVLMFRLDCFGHLVKQELNFKALLLVDNDRKMTEYIRKGIREKRFKTLQSEPNILLMNFEMTLSLLDMYEHTHDVHISIKIP